jgi:hypothetical protein
MLQSIFLMCNLAQASFCIFLFNEPISLCELAFEHQIFQALGLAIAISLRSSLVVTGI